MTKTKVTNKIKNLDYDEMIIHAIQGTTKDSTAKIFSTIIRIAELECARCEKQGKSFTKGSAVYPDSPITFRVSCNPNNSYSWNRGTRANMEPYTYFSVSIESFSSRAKTLNMEEYASMLQEEELLGVRSEDLKLSEGYISPGAKRLQKLIKKEFEDEGSC